MPLTGTPRSVTGSYGVGEDVTLWCSHAARYRFDGTPAGAEDTLLAAGAVMNLRLTAGNTALSVVAEGTPAAGARCTLGRNPRTRFNLITRDAVPDFRPDCSVDDADPERAANCRALRAATYDVVGHLRHVQPARPRWAVLPRDVDDICCHPGPGMQCPTPIKQCQ